MFINVALFWQDPMGTLNRTLPPLNSSLRGLPPLGQTQSLAQFDDTLNKKTLPHISKIEGNGGVVKHIKIYN